MFLKGLLIGCFLIFPAYLKGLTGFGGSLVGLCRIFRLLEGLLVGSDTRRESVTCRVLKNNLGYLKGVRRHFCFLGATCGVVEKNFWLT